MQYPDGTFSGQLFRITHSQNILMWGASIGIELGAGGMEVRQNTILLLRHWYWKSVARDIAGIKHFSLGKELIALSPTKLNAILKFLNVINMVTISVHRHTNLYCPNSFLHFGAKITLLSISLLDPILRGTKQTNKNHTIGGKYVGSQY